MNEGTNIGLGQRLNITAVPLFQLDVNYDSLKKLLDGIDGSIGKCESSIESVKTEVISRPRSDEIASGYKLMAKAASIYDTNFLKILNNSVNQEQFKMGKSSIEQETEPLCQKLNLIGNACTYLFGQIQQQGEKISSLETALQEKADSKSINEKIKKQKKKQKEKIEQTQKGLEERVAACEKSSSEQLGNFETIVKDVERRTIWKIQDCQDLLAKRVNVEFVNEALLSLEKQLKDQINSLTGGGSDKIDRLSLKMNQKIQEMDESLNERAKGLKQSLKDLENQLKVGFVTVEKHNETQKTSTDRLSQLQVRLKCVEKDLDFGETIDQHKNSFVDFDHRIKQIESELQKNQQNQLSQGELLGIEALFKKLDPHKLCSLEADLRVTEENIIRHDERIAALQSDVKRKLESVEFFSSLNQRGGNDQGSLKPEDIKKLVMDSIPKQLIDEEKYKKIQKDLSEMNVKMENAGEIEKRVARIFKEVDINGIVRQLKTKANADDTKKELFTLDARCSQLSEMLSFLRRDYDQLTGQLKKSSAVNIQSQQQTHQTQAIETNSLLTTKRLYPLNCLSCGPSQYLQQQTFQQQHQQQPSAIVKQRTERMSRTDILNRSMAEYNVIDSTAHTLFPSDEKTIFNNLSIPTPKKNSAYSGQQSTASSSQVRARPYSATTRKSKQ